LPFEDTAVDSPAGRLPAWFVPAHGGAPGPAVLLVHGWDSARDRTLPNVRFLNAAGFHCLTFDVRGHGDNPAEQLPVSVAEFGADTLAAVRGLLERPEVTRAGILGHSLGGVGAILAAANEPRTAALVSVSAPSGPVFLTRQTFRLARLPIPDPVAWPLAWLTTRVYLRPRGHAISEMSASRALARYHGALLLIHGDDDLVVPPVNLRRLERSAKAARGDGSPFETLVVEGGEHSWLYEHEPYRRAVAGFLARALGGPLSAVEAEERAGAIDCVRLPETDQVFAAAEDRPRGVGVLRAMIAVRRPQG
jgi:pimeloyl-ACP methyl ester carboxylesterase